MSIKNDFKAFAIKIGANVVDQNIYENSPELQDGFYELRRSDLHVLNKALRQSSTISSVVANFIATESGSDVLDDGNVTKITAQLNKALEQKIKVESDNRFVRLNTNTKTSGCILSKAANLGDDPSLRDLSLSGFLRPNGWANLDGLAIHVAHPGAGIPHSRGISFEYGSTSGGQEGFGIHTYAFDKDGKFKGKKRILIEDVNSAFDANGFLKRVSPIVKIYSDGEFSTNEESEGAKVTKEGTGVYRISNISGCNADDAWGEHGGISAPKDKNGLELIFIDNRIQSDGSIIIETFHRQHSHLPTRFQNWRLKCIDDNDERVFYKDGEPCDIPENCRLDIRVQMPEDSSWNLKQNRLQEEIEGIREK
ncbi:hypothetical protein Ppb6_02008 [Photorhabdus australis subsp. thailandensis]|uniref:Phage tail protein C-terminal domain-containing protein n=1 Tax=Photorhabdus australis subsp. thailandensis TaxID=2805096 RepID=A0A1C0U455_9GAMM|nr:hypothetical protein [Photorhabdus australis]OCQ52665.1 hypothetical protein Ppb6_02008 [Photorhabdus australis subsp. thailandensis]